MAADVCIICKGEVPGQQFVPAGKNYELRPMEPRPPIDGHPICSPECARTYQGGRLLARFLDFMAGVEYTSRPVPDYEDWPR